MIPPIRQKQNWQNQFPVPACDMDNARFRFIQDSIFHLTGKEFAALLKVDPASISKWRTDNREIPDYIGSLIELLAAQKMGELQLMLPLNDLIGLSRAAEQRGLTVEALLLQIIRGVIRQPVSYTADAKQAEAAPAKKVAEGIVYKGPTSLAKPHKDPH
jgi:hypothetical protein